MFELQHIIVSSMPVADHRFNWFWFVGSLIPDIDHLFVLYKHRMFSWKKIVDALKFEDKYNIHFKTKYGHSLFGAIIFSLPVVLISRRGGMYFFAAYILHLLMDWPDKDEKQYFYPLKIKTRGLLPILSKWEILFTVVLLGLTILMYLKI